MRTVAINLPILVCFALNIAAQDPTKVAPDTYKLQFENDYVKVLRVTYAPRSKVPVHDHSRFPAAYVYLSDSGPIRFVHSGWDDPVLTRPATRAGSFRLSPTRFDDETHAVENNGPLVSEFLRIEIKTDAPSRGSLSGRFAPFAGDRKLGTAKVEFDNAQIRATRIISRPGERLDVKSNVDAPSLLVVLSGSGSVQRGETIWLASSESRTFAQNEQIELLKFDFKTKPKKP